MKDKNKNKQPEVSQTEIPKEANQKKENSRDDEILKLAAQAKHWENEYYRAYADMQNLRKQIEADHREAIKYRAEGFVDRLLPALDAFHMALQNEGSTPEMKNFLVGFSYIYRNLVQILESEGVTEYAPKVDDKFDPSFMQALETKDDEGAPNRVLEVKSKGYKLYDHLIRPAMVVVSKKPHSESAEDVKQENKEETATKADA